MSSDAVVDAEDEDSFKTFKKWLTARGFDPPPHLKLVHFKATGLRGLMTTRRIEENERVVSVPENVLVTTKTVMCSPIGSAVRNFRPKLSPLRALCAFLVVERCRGATSEWSPYISILPESYATPLFWPACAIRALPDVVQESARRQKAELKSEYEKLRPFLKLLQTSLQLSDRLLDFELFRWAWCSVNTRCVFMRPQEPSEGLNGESDCCALAPFLDLLNHSCEARVRAGFNAATGTYDVVTLRPVAKFEQVYISYGFHDNAKLFLEYGFVLCGNPHSAVQFAIEELKSAVEDALGPAGLKWSADKLLFVERMKDLCCTRDGPSWSLTSTIDLLTGHLPEPLDGPTVSSKVVLKALLETRLRHSRLNKEKLRLKRMSATHAAVALELLDEEIEILNAIANGVVIGV